MIYPEAEETDETEDEAEGSETVCGILSKFWQEIRNFKKYFNINDCAEGIILKVFLPANDIISDFLFAEKLLQSENPIIRQWFTFFAYYFIAWPGVMFLLSYISFFGGKYLGRHCQGSFLPFVLMMSMFSLEAVIVMY